MEFFVFVFEALCQGSFSKKRLRPNGLTNYIYHAKCLSTPQVSTRKTPVAKSIPVKVFFNPGKPLCTGKTMGATR